MRLSFLQIFSKFFQYFFCSNDYNLKKRKEELMVDSWASQTNKKNIFYSNKRARRKTLLLNNGTCNFQAKKSEWIRDWATQTQKIVIKILFDFWFNSDVCFGLSHVVKVCQEFFSDVMHREWFFELKTKERASKIMLKLKLKFLLENYRKISIDMQTRLLLLSITVT